VPAPGDSVDVDGLRLTVESTDGRRVGKVLVTRMLDKQEPPPENGENPDARPARPARKTASAKTRR
jgi:Mg2+/Co2+ transporter CorC